jgi:hypothetical protein
MHTYPFAHNVVIKICRTLHSPYPADHGCCRYPELYKALKNAR